MAIPALSFARSLQCLPNGNISTTGLACTTGTVVNSPALTQRTEYNAGPSGARTVPYMSVASYVPSAQVHGTAAPAVSAYSSVPSTVTSYSMPRSMEAGVTAYRQTTDYMQTVVTAAPVTTYTTGRSPSWPRQRQAVAATPGRPGGAPWAKPATTEPKDENTVIVACVGDSLTYEGVYPAKLQEMLASRYPGKTWKVQNYGAFGTTAQQWIPYMGNGVFNRALQSNADIVVVLLGTNDSQANLPWKEQDYAASLQKVVQRIETEMTGGKPQVILTVPPPVYPGMDWSWRFRPEVINGIIPSIVKRLASRNGLEVADAHTALGGVALSKPEVSMDGCHLTPEGNHMLAACVCDAVLRSFQRTKPLKGGSSVVAAAGRRGSVTVAAGSPWTVGTVTASAIPTTTTATATTIASVATAKPITSAGSTKVSPYIAASPRIAQAATPARLRSYQPMTGPVWTTVS